MLASKARTIAGLAGLVLGWLCAVPAVAEMRMALVPLGDASRCGNTCPLVMQLDGQITGQTADRFVEFARGATASGRLRNVVFLHSPGGSVIGSLKLGAVLRTLGSTVIVARIRARSVAERQPAQGRRGVPTADIVNGVCNSACVYAMMGGKSRVVPPESRLGVHRMQAEVFHGLDVASGTAVFEKLKGSTEQVDFLRRYARIMGVDPSLIAVAEAVPHDDIKVLTRMDVRRFRLGREKL
jgi:hypothetical protein